MVYQGTVETCPTENLLDRLYLKFNTDQPADFKGHSFSVSDVVVIQRRSVITAHYVDKRGFSEVLVF